MKPIFMQLILVVLLVFSLSSLGSSAYACQFDTDCEVGSTCLKSSGNLYGYCIGGLYPGNQNDQRPWRDPLDIYSATIRMA